MKNLKISLILASSLAILCLSSCNKDDDMGYGGTGGGGMDIESYQKTQTFDSDTPAQVAQQ